MKRLGLLETDILEADLAADFGSYGHMFAHYFDRLGGAVLSLQGHPEFTRDYLRRLMARRRERLGEPHYRAALASLAQPTDADAVGRWLLRFIGASAPAGNDQGTGPSAAGIIPTGSAPATTPAPSRVRPPAP